jgi:hypothetical protein
MQQQSLRWRQALPRTWGTLNSPMNFMGKDRTCRSPAKNSIELPSERLSAPPDVEPGGGLAAPAGC